MFTIKRVFLTLVAFAFLAACNKQEQVTPPSKDVEINLAKGESLVADGYIITYNTNNTRIAFRSENYEQRAQTVLDYTQKLVQQYGINPENVTRTYNTALQGFAAKLSPKQLEALKKDPKIASIEQDRILTLDYKVVKTGTFAREYTTYGIARVGSASGAGRTAWVLDTGIDLDHADLNVNTSRSRSFVGVSANDVNGHGTHVAGTIAAKRSNNAGLYGVAYDATVVAVKVLSNSGSGSISGIVNGVDYVASAARRGDVANMSLGGGASTALDNAVRRLGDRGILVSLAAGNSRTNAGNTSPARVNHPNVVTVSAMDSNDRFASFSNYGSVVDYCSPGVNIWSTWPGNRFNQISGTSMAAPHVAGLLLLRGSTNLRTNGTVRNDPDGRPDPIAVR